MRWPPAAPSEGDTARVGPPQLRVRAAPRARCRTRTRAGRALPTVNATVLGIALDRNTLSGGNWTPDVIRNYLDTLDEALTKLTTAGAQIGAMQNRLEANLQNLDVMTQNITEANSRIIDTDIAAETATMTTQQVRQQAAASVLAQVNQLPAIALTLLQ